MRSVHIFIISLACVIMIGLPVYVSAQTVSIDAQKLVPHVDVNLSPRTGSFVEGSTFEVPIIIDTKGSNINSIEIRISFDRNKISIIKPLNGNSIIGVWVEPPKYDNTRGTASYVGVIPNGITTGSGFIGTITFKAIQTGKAVISVASNSAVLLNDGLGTAADVGFGRAEYLIIPKAPEGVRVYSETHPSQSEWYNNNNASLSWERDGGVTGFSFILDDKPSTVPDDTVDTEDISKSFPTIGDGLWYFHIKAIKNAVWGTTGHFLVRVDTTPPASFKPQVSYLLAALISIDRTLVSFFTTDNLSGVDHYEVGIIDKNQPVTESPVFVQAESPFQVPIQKGSNLEVIVRAIDKAGNVRDESIAVKPPFVITQFLRDNIVYILLFIILLGLFILITHYLVGHHILRYMRRVFLIMKKEEAQEVLKEEIEHQMVESEPTDTKLPPSV